MRDKQQFVNIGSARSKVLSLPNGVIQGSVFGPLLFVIFIYDLPDAIRTAITILYVDGLKLCKVINCIDNRLEL